MADLQQQLTERLSELVQQILEAVEDSVGRYREETVRTKRENESLRRKLQLLISNGGGSIRSSSGPLNAPPVQQQTLNPQVPVKVEVQVQVQSCTASEDSGKAPPPLVLRSSSSIHASDPVIKAEDEEMALDRLDVVGLSPRMVMPSGPSEAQSRDHEDDHGLHHFPVANGIPRQADQRRKPYACESCSKSFSQSADLRRHMRTHTGERPHPCTFCSKSFSQRGNLRRHLRIHTGERPYGCPQCGRTFSDGDTLKKHKRTHLHQRPHCCPQCGRTFSCSNGLRTHMRRSCGTDHLKLL